MLLDEVKALRKEVADLRRSRSQFQHNNNVRRKRSNSRSKAGIEKISILIKVWNVNKSRPWRRRAAIFRKLRSACVEVGTHRRKFRLCRGWKYHKHLRRGVNSNNFNYITCEEVKSQWN
ncbi:hypothetical protein TNCV_2297551 [Trichonephila clavipes]|nr:hypothetical protein TNCV_2297551 [Trichonephila clavipes]